MHLAEFNFGTLAHPWGDPRIAGFENAISQVNAIAERSPGFVWRLSDEAMETEQEDPNGPLADRPNTASTLSIWVDAPALYHFVTRTLHARIMKGAPDWFVPGDSGFLVCWWVAEGARPTVAEGMARWRDLQARGETPDVFGAPRLKALALGAAA
ncbi:MAG: DUF3291 domain-containing protein [Pseudomonadota bacterium]